MKTLEELREEIDEIDTELHNLLVRRIKIGQEVAKAKKVSSTFNLRPGREAQILRRLISRNTTPLSAYSIYRIWREILSANLNQQTQINAAVYLPSRDYHDLAQDYCGSSSKIIEFSMFEEVLDQVTKGLAHIGMVPGFWDNLDGRSWDKFAEVSEENSLRVISVVPILKRQGATKSLAIIAKQKAEETGDDSSLFAIKGDSGEANNYIIDLGPDCNWKLAVVDGYTESLKVPEGTECLHIGNFANVILAS